MEIEEMKKTLKILESGIEKWESGLNESIIGCNDINERYNDLSEENKEKMIIIQENNNIVIDAITDTKDSLIKLSECPTLAKQKDSIESSIIRLILLQKKCKDFNNHAVFKKNPIKKDIKK